MEEYWLWICSQKRLYRPDIAKLIRVFRTPEAVFFAKKEELVKSGSIKAEQISELLESKADWKAEKKYHELREKGITFISAEHRKFPKRLKEIADYPFGLFFKGRLPEDERMTVGIVGTRRCSYYGKYMAERLAKALAEQGVQIISGMALGIDGCAQSAALSSGGESYGVLGCGVDVCYPSANRQLYEQLPEKGGILSEYPPGRAPLALHFPIRNRLISGLSDCLLVIEAKERSGSLITADMALEQGKDIYAVPGRIGDPLSTGCNRLISQGAGIVLSEKELMGELNFRKGTKLKSLKNKNLLETKENLVYSCVDFHARSLNDIICDVQLPVQEVMTVLTILVMKGFIEEPMKNYYIKIK